MVYFKILMVYKKYNQGEADIGKSHPSNGKGAVILDFEKTRNLSIILSSALHSYDINVIYFSIVRVNLLL